MIINTLEDMEKVVSSSNNLKWDGWTVIVTDDIDGYYTKDGVFLDNKWVKQYRFDMIDYNKWNIPDRYIKYVQV